MLPLPTFNPLDTAKYASGSGYIQVGAADAGSKILLYNESPANMTIDFQNGNVSILHAWEARYWTLDGDVRILEWSITTSLNVTNPPISLVIGELYRPDEMVEGSYPMALIRQASVGNPGGIQTTGSTGIANDGNGPGTSLVEATVLGQVSSSVTLTNDALLRLQVIIAGALVQVLKTATTDPLLALGAAAHLVEILGNLTIDGTTTHTGAVQVNNTLGVTGASTLAGVTEGNTQINGTLGVTGASSLAGVTEGNTQVNGTLGVTGASTFAGVTETNTQINGTLGVTGAATMAAITAAAETLSGLLTANAGIVVPTGQAITNHGSETIDGALLVGGTIGANGGGSGFDGSNNVYGINYIQHANGIATIVTNQTLNDTMIRSQTTTGGVHMQTSGAVGLGYFDTAGLHLEGAGLSINEFFADGSKLASVHIGTSTASTSGVTWSHGCNKAPQHISASPNSGSAAGSATIGVGNITATTALITCGAALTGMYLMAFTFN